MSNRTVYNLAPDVQSYYNNKSVPRDSRGRLGVGSMLTKLHLSSNRTADFTYAGLAEIFAVENFTASATDGTGSGVSTSGAGDSENGSASPSTTSNSSSGSEGRSKISPGAIAGSVVGGVVGIAVIGAVALYLLKTRMSRRGRLQQGAHGKGVGQMVQPGIGGNGALCDEVTHAEMPEPISPRREVEGSTPHAELPSCQRYELS